MKRRAGIYSGGLSALLSRLVVSKFSGSSARQLLAETNQKIFDNHLACRPRRERVERREAASGQR
jgi:hypothetical protein